MSFLLRDYKEMVKRQISLDEGYCSHLYKDSKGFNTIGYGFNLDKIQMPQDVSSLWLDHIINDTEYTLSKALSFWNDLDPVRKAVLINMAYNLGITGLLAFHQMLEYLAKKDYISAEKEMANSKWNNEVSLRAFRLRRMMLLGEF